MEYISAEEFLKQPKEVQNVFIKWWKPSKGDLYFESFSTKNIRTVKINNQYKCYILPLFTEGQLREFIEGKKNCVIAVDFNMDTGYILSLYYIEFDEFETDYFSSHKTYVDLGNNLLQAYWKVACEIAKEGTSNV